VKKDPKWQETKNTKAPTGKLANKVAKDFGYSESKKATPKPTAKASAKPARRQPGEVTPGLKKWLDSLPAYERRVAMTQIKGEKKAGKLSKGTK
jgi:hypothetical protein